MEVSEDDESIDMDAEAAPEEVDDVEAEKSDEEVSKDSQLYLNEVRTHAILA
jgi:hypothetical protein